MGIGTSAPSGAKLEIFTASTSTDGLKISRYTPGNYYSTLRQDNHGLAIHVGTGGTVSERVAITPNGITFNGDTAAANALDDYEEGTFNLSSITFQTSGSATINNQTNSYTKIGNLVTCIMFVNVTFGSGCAGHMFFNGLPFVPIAISEAVMSYNNQSGSWTKDGNMFTNTNSTILWYERGQDPSNVSNFNMWLQTTYMTTA